MRDIFVTLIVFGSLPFILRTPRLGAYVWVWLAMMVPHRLAYGFAMGMPFSLLVGVATLIGFAFTRDKFPLPRSPILGIYLGLMFWMTVTSAFALDTQAAIWPRWVDIMKIHVFIFLTMMLIRGRAQIDRLLWVMALSLGFYGLKGGIFTLMTGGSGRVWGPPGGVIAGNNALGVALVMLVPLLYYLMQQVQRKLLRRAMVGLMVLTALSILGTQSRGALLSLLAMATLLALRGKRPVVTTVGIGVLLVLAIGFMPDTWSSRMNTIESYDQDMSAMSRIYTWTTLWNLALDRPLVGAGFNAAIAIVFQTYAPTTMGAFDFTNTVLVAHSIYFQALGEHGFPGLILYVVLGLTAWLRAGHLARQAATDPEYATWVPLLMRMLQVSFVGFAVGGAFLSLVNFDLPFYLVAVVLLVDATMREGTARPSETRASPVALPRT